MITLADAARDLGVTTATLRQQIHAGQLKATRFGPIWVVSEVEIARYRLENRGRVGRPFVGRPGYVDTRHIRVRLFLAPADGRGHDALWFQYIRQSFVLDLDLTNAVPFQATRQTYEHLDLLTDSPPGGRTIELWNREHVATEIGARQFEVSLLVDIGQIAPPAVTFRDGPVWDAAAIERWRAEQPNTAAPT
jgi:hypothetical protein